MARSSKSEKKEDRIQELELELKLEKKKNQELQKQKTVRLDEEQLAQFLEELTKRSDGRTEHIVQEIQDKRMTVNVHTGARKQKDWFSITLKTVLSILFIAAGIAVIYGLTQIWGKYWSIGWVEKASLLIIGTASIVCILIGIDIHREKDRNYMVSLFSALVALVALIVSLVK